MCLLIGFIMGSIAFLIDLLSEGLTEYRWESTEETLQRDILLGWVVLVLYSLLFVTIASLLTIYVAPATLGSGVAEAMGILNGV
jgi:H+/Cl- antiporter ClcA